MQKQSDSQKKPSRRKYIITTIIILCILAGYIYKVVTWTTIDSEFKKQSEAIIRQEVAKRLTTDPNNPIDPNELTDEDFAGISSFELDQKELSDIKLLEKCTNLETLNLICIEYPVNNRPAWMKILRKLNIKISYERLCIDLKPIRKLNKLQKIDLCNFSYFSGSRFMLRGGISPFKNIEPLSSLTNLTYLNLSGTYVSNIEPIKNLRNLQELDISFYTNVSDLEPLKGLTNLRELNFGSTKVSNLEPLRGLTNLQYLIISSTQVTDLEPLSGLIHLDRLRLGGTPIYNLEPLKNLTYLKDLHLEETQVSNLEPLRGLTNLRYLYLEKTQVSNLEPLKRLPYLQNLYIRNCPKITDEQVQDLQKALPKLDIHR